MQPADAVVEIGDPPRVAAADDHGGRIAAGGTGGGNLRTHLLRFDDLLAGQVTAPLRAALVFELDRGCAGRFQFQHAVGDLFRSAKPGVGIDDERNLNGRGEQPGLGHELVEREDANVGHAEHTGREGRPGEIDRLETLPLDELGGQGDRRAGDRKRALAGKPAERRATGGQRPRVGGKRHRWYPADGSDGSSGRPTGRAAESSL